MIRRRVASLCRAIGRHVPYWTQGGGGNVSFKRQSGSNPILIVKASGCRLDNVSSTRGLASVRIDTLKKLLDEIDPVSRRAEQAYADSLIDARDDDGERPSMETGFHVILPSPWVVHFHSLAALAMAHESRQRPRAFRSWMRRHWSGAYTIIEPTDPGLQLTRRLRRARHAPLILLENHGLILQGKTTRELERWKRLEKQFCSDWNHPELMPRNRSTAFPSPPLAPLRIYMPDSAVFVTRLQRHLLRRGALNGEPLYQLSPRATRTDPDAAELWQASALLFRSCPCLAELPARMARRIANFPTEKFRRSVV